MMLKPYSEPEMLPAMEQARQRIDDAQLEKWESLLGLQSPNRAFQDAVLWAAALYFAGRDPAQEDREILTDLRKFNRELGKCVKQLQRLLDPVPIYRTSKRPRIGLATLQYDALFADCMLLGLEDKLQLGRAFGQSKSERANVQFYATLQAGLKKLAELSERRAVLLAKARVPPRRKLDRERWIARLLYKVFAASTGENPAKHVRSNTEKTHYTGKFFEFVDGVLTQVGFRQQPAARGELVKSALKWARASKVALRSPKTRR